MFCFLFLSFFSGCLRRVVRSAERLYVPPSVVPNESSWIGSTGLGRSDHWSLFCSEVTALRVSSPYYLTFSACLSSSAYQSIFQRRTVPLSPAPVPFKGHRWSDAPPATELRRSRSFTLSGVKKMQRKRIQNEDSQERSHTLTMMLVTAMYSCTRHTKHLRTHEHLLTYFIWMGKKNKKRKFYL